MQMPRPSVSAGHEPSATALTWTLAIASPKPINANALLPTTAATAGPPMRG